MDRSPDVDTRPIGVVMVTYVKSISRHRYYMFLGSLKSINPG